MLEDQLQDVLNRAHAEHVYRYDRDLYGVNEHWEIGLEGDCEDFALWCRQELKQIGIHADLVYCKVETGEGHLVLHVEGWVLDNRHKWVMRQEDLPYEWLRMNDANGNWYSVKKE